MFTWIAPSKRWPPPRAGPREEWERNRETFRPCCVLAPARGFPGPSKARQVTGHGVRKHSQRTASVQRAGREGFHDSPRATDGRLVSLALDLLPAGTGGLSRLGPGVHLNRPEQTDPGSKGCPTCPSVTCAAHQPSRRLPAVTGGCSGTRLPLLPSQPVHSGTCSA